MVPRLLLFSILASFSLYCSQPSHAICAELHHRDSLSSMTMPEKIRAVANRSSERVRYWHSLSRISNSISASELSLSSKLYPATFEFLVEISLGSPPVTILGAPDTGSDLTWTKCAPCNNCTSTDFNPRKFSSYKRLRCDSNPCSDLRGFTNCGRRRSC